MTRARHADGRRPPGLASASDGRAYDASDSGDGCSGHRPPVSQWKAHKLAGDPRDGLNLRLGQRCRARVELPGVPDGTAGTVMLTGGFQWLRYRVRFDNGVEVPFLDGRHLVTVPKRFGRH